MNPTGILNTELKHTLSRSSSQPTTSRKITVTTPLHSAHPRHHPLAGGVIVTATIAGTLLLGGTVAHAAEPAAIDAPAATFEAPEQAILPAPTDDIAGDEGDDDPEFLLPMPEVEPELTLPMPEVEPELTLPAPEVEPELTLPMPEAEPELTLPTPEVEPELTLPTPEVEPTPALPEIPSDPAPSIPDLASGAAEVPEIAGQARVGSPAVVAAPTLAATGASGAEALGTLGAAFAFMGALLVSVIARRRTR